MQTGLFLERGWNRHWRGLTIQPNVALQYLWVYQDDYTARGPSASSYDDLNAHSLRSVVGVNLTGRKRCQGLGICRWTPTARVNWMHEYLDTTTSVTGNTGGSSFIANGLDLGRDWAVLGAGLLADRNAAVSLFGNYDLILNERQQFHNFGGGVIWTR
jgi:outer membrane autotransporter protein